MKKYLLAAFALLLAFGAQAQVLSLFTWEPGTGPSGHFTADIGPNGTSVGTLGNKRATGNGSPNALAPGSQLVPLACCANFCPAHSSCTNPVGYNLDFVVNPASATYFNRGSMTWRIDFNRRNNEAAANFFDRGTSLRFGTDCCGIVYIQYRVTQAASPFFESIGSPDPGTGGFTGGTEGETISSAGSNQWFTHTFIYDSISGIGEVWRNDQPTPRWSSAAIGKARPGQSLYWATAPAAYTIGRRCDGMGTGLTTFDNATVSAPVPTPVTLTYFRGSNHGYEALLEWETTSETNSKNFQIERFDPDKNEWSLVGVVNAAGNSASPKSYSYFDRNPHSGTNIYVLRQFDLNGSNRPAQTIEVYFDGFADRVLEVYPNPVSEGAQFNVRYESHEDCAANMSILNIEGQVVRSFKIDTYAGVNTYSFDTEGLPAGMYLFKTEIGSKSSTKKFVVTR
jgi:hypothetical protein